MSGIFVSYRRASSAACAYRLVDDLKERFGHDAIFFDVESIDPGIPFPQAIRRALAKSSIALIVIGPQWATIKDQQDNRRLDNPDDWVRHEVNAALNSGARVIPLLVEGAEVPGPEALPEDIRELANLQAFTINKSPEYWDFDIKRLEERLRKIDRTLPWGKEHPAPGAEPKRPPQEASGKFSKKVIWGYVVAGLFAFFGLPAAQGDPDTVYGNAVFFVVAFALHLTGLLDINKGLARGKAAALAGMVLSGVLIVFAVAMGVFLESAAVQNVLGDQYYPDTSFRDYPAEPQPPFTNVQPPPAQQINNPAPVAYDTTRPPDLTGNWSSNIGASYQFGNNLNGTIFFYEFNALQVQVGYGQGSYADGVFTFNYQNTLLGTTAVLQMTPGASGNVLQGRLTNPVTGQPMVFELYRL